MNTFESNQALKTLIGWSHNEFGVVNRWYPGVSTTDPTKISYFKTETGFDAWDDQARQKHAIQVKPGKFFKHIMPLASDSTIQELVTKWLAIVNPTVDLNIETDIPAAYHKENYEGSGGSLGSSCMRYPECGEFLEFYEHYPVKVLVLRKAGKVAGRALLWSGIMFRHGVYDYLDRIYTHDFKDVQHFVNWAASHNTVTHEGESEFNHASLGGWADNIEVKPLDDFTPEKAPYCDTFSGMDESWTLTNQSNVYALQSTGGIIEGMECCPMCGCRMDRDTSFYIDSRDEYICEDCASDFTWCSVCERYVNNEDSYVLPDGGSICHYCLANSHTWTLCSECEDVVLCDETYIIEGLTYCESCTSNLFNYCDECEEFTRDDVIEINGSWMCPECANDWTECLICGDWTDDGHDGCCPDCSTCSECGTRSTLTDDLCPECAPCVALVKLKVSHA